MGLEYLPGLYHKFKQHNMYSYKYSNPMVGTSFVENVLVTW